MHLALVALLAVRQAETVTLQRTGTVTDILRDISDKTHVVLEAGKIQGREILIVSLNNAPLREAMDRIAYATYCRWEKSGNGYRLIEDISAEHAAEQEYDQRTVDLAKAAIAKFRREVGSGKEPGNAEGGSAASYRLLSHLLDNLAPKNLSDRLYDQTFLTGSMATFTTFEVPGAFSLRNAAPNLDAYAKEVKIPPQSLPLRAILTGRMTLDGGSAIALLFTRDGKCLPDRPALTMPSEGRPVGKLPSDILEAIPDDLRVPLSPNSKLFDTPAGTGFYNPTPDAYRVMTDVLERLRNPEKYEPLGTLVTDTLVELGARLHRNVVANVDDQAAWMVPQELGGAPKMRKVLSQLWSGGMKLEPGWIVDRPVLFNPPWAHRVSREELGRLVRTAVSEDKLAETFALGTFALNCGSWTVPSTVADLIRVGSADARPQYASHQWAFPRFFASLPEAARNRWLRGEKVDIASLPEATRYYLMVWAEQTAIIKPAEGTTDFAQQQIAQFPSGIATRGVLSAEIKSVPGYCSRAANRAGPVRWAEARRLAAALYDAEQSGRTVPDFEIQEVDRQDLILQVRADNMPGVASQPFGYFSPDPAKYVLWSHASPEFRKKLFDAMKQP